MRRATKFRRICVVSGRKCRVTVRLVPIGHRDDACKMSGILFCDIGTGEVSGGAEYNI